MVSTWNELSKGNVTNTDPFHHLSDYAFGFFFFMTCDMGQNPGYETEVQM